ncbi:MAG: vWA domain-containing protein [Chryseobacterium sp.]
MSSKGKVDLVFLLDVSGSMSECLDAVKSNLSSFVESLGNGLKGGPNDPYINLDIRYKVCGYRDHVYDGDKWFIDHSFVRDINELKKQFLSPDMRADGGGDEPESLIDAIYTVGMMPESGLQENEGDKKWRSGVHHCVLIFTDATYKPATIPEIIGAGYSELYNKVALKKLKLFGMVPQWEGYDDLSTFPGSQFTQYVEGPSVANLGKQGPEGEAASIAAVNALKNRVMNKDDFKKFIELLGKSVSKAAVAEAC